MLIPPINSKGVFVFSEPFNTIIPSNQIYVVTSIRSLVELYNSNEQPYDTIYKAVGLSEADFKADVDANIPIVVFSTTGNELFYVPGNRILSMPDISGVQYMEKVIAIPLGPLPLDYDLSLVETQVQEVVYNTVGVNSVAKTVLASAVILYSEDQDATFRALLAHKKTVDKSHLTMYLELKVRYDALLAKHTALEACVKAQKCK
jgi:hypothetical protein